MKYIVIMLLCCFSAIARAGDLFQATHFAYALTVKGQYAWSDWETSDVKIYVDTDNLRIIVYSPQVQTYRIVKVYKTIRDSRSKSLLTLDVIDQNGDKAVIRLRQEYSGSRQMYVDYLDITWVYKIVLYE